MRKCVVAALAILTALCFTLPAQANAQAVFLGVGATVPTGDFSDFGDGDGASAGWLANGGVVFPLNEDGLYVFGEGMYGSNSHDYEGDKTNLLGGFAGIEMGFGEEGEAAPFVFGQVGFLRHEYKSDDFTEFEGSSSGLAFGGGAGYGFPLGESMRGWVLGRYLQGQTSDDEAGDGNTTFLNFGAGISIPFGG